MGVGVALASVYAANKSDSAAKSAGRTQAAATDRATDETRRQFEQTRGDLAPFRNAGITALTGRGVDPRQQQLEDLTSRLEGVSPTITEMGRGSVPGFGQPGSMTTEAVRARRGGATTTTTERQNPEFQELQSQISSLRGDIEQNPFQPDAGPGLTDLVTDPEAQRDFVSDNPFFTALADDAQDRLFSNQAARGKLGSGETAEALQNSLLLLGSDLLNQNITQRQNLASMGQSAAAQTGQFGAQAARSIADLGTSGAAARAAGEVGAANAINRGVNNATSTITNLYALNKMFPDTETTPTASTTFNPHRAHGFG